MPYVCAGKYARIIDGQFATMTAGQRTEKKVTIKTLKEPMPGRLALIVRFDDARCNACLHTDFNSFFVPFVYYPSS